MLLCSVNSIANIFYYAYGYHLIMNARRKLTEEEVRVKAACKKAWDDFQAISGWNQDRAASELGYKTQSAFSQYINVNSTTPPIVLGLTSLIFMFT